MNGRNLNRGQGQGLGHGNGQGRKLRFNQENVEEQGIGRGLGSGNKRQGGGRGQRLRFNQDNVQGQGFGRGNRKEHVGGRGQEQGGGRGRGYSETSYCECAKCGAKIPHQRGVKCTDSKCPECGNTMVNEALLHKKDK